MTEEETTSYIFIDNTPAIADVAIVMGTSKTIHEAVQKTADLYTSGVVPLIIVTGGENERMQKNEAEVISQKLEELGVPNDAILKETKATNTLENVLFTKSLIENSIGFDNIRSVIAVTRNYHARRVLMTFKKHFPEGVQLYASSYESAAYSFSRDNWYNLEIGKKKVLEELSKIKEYLEKGDIEELPELL